MSKWMDKLKKLEGAAVAGESNPLLDCLQSPSPSVNWAFAIPGHGLPFGYSMVLYGPPKGGKSIICNAMIGELHRMDPEAEAITFNTEMRAEIQANSSQLSQWGIDPNRFAAFDRNTPDGIFDFIENDIAANCQEGQKVKLIIIDSLTNIMGRRSMNADGVMQQQIGDDAMTIQVGLKRILPVIRKHKIALILTAHLRAELDQREIMRGKTVKMAAAWATKHFAEFFALIQPNQSKEGKVSLAGEEFTTPDVVDFMDKAQKTGRKIRFTITESSLGVEGRTAEFTLDYNRGIINTYEEIFTLAVNLGVIQRPNNQMYQYKDKTWRGVVNCLTALRDDDQLQKEILKEVFLKDIK